MLHRHSMANRANRANPQHGAVCKYTTVICDSISASGNETITLFTERLVEVKLIPNVVHEEAIGGNRRQAAATILTTIQDVVKDAPEKFDDFLRALRNSDLGEIADQLHSECCKL